MISFIFSFKPWLRKTLAVLYLLTIAVISLMPSHDLPHFTKNKIIDKVIHLCMYLGLSFLAGWNYDIINRQLKYMFMLLAGVFMYGVIMEILQRTMHNGRDFDFKDMIANLTGTIIGLLIYRFLDRKHTEMQIPFREQSNKNS